MRGSGDTRFGGHAAPSRQDQDVHGHPGPGVGRLTVVGLGPGDARLLTPQAAGVLAGAAVVVGYSTYLDLLDPAVLAGKRVVATGMTGEVERCRAAVESALSGADTVVVSGGDAGVYGMAGLVLEMLEARALLDTVPFEAVPGIPAIIGAAALLGAPLTHDFAAVSLSDLLTPWELIERRLNLAAEADFVLGVYNPRSKKRSGLLARAFAIIGRHRAPETPVGFVRNAWREGQAVRLTTLAEADADWADMLTIVLVGNSQTRMCDGWMLTPRGYGNKYRLER